MKGNLYIIVGNPLSDIGKGWLAGSVASLPSSFIIKVDPVLRPIDITRAHETADACTYKQLGVEFQSNQLFCYGNILLEFLEKHRQTVIEDMRDIPRLTFGELGLFFADKICDVFTQSKKSNLVVEVGGSVTDRELPPIPRVLASVAQRLQLNMKILLLSYLDYTEDPHVSNPIKMQHVTYAIEQTRSIYSEPYLVFFRRRNLPIIIESNIPSLVDAISRRTLYPKEQIIYMPNFKSPMQECDFIKRVFEFSEC